MTSGENHKKHILKRVINYTLSLGLSVIFLLIAFNNVELGDVFRKVSEASIWWVALFIVVFIISHIIRAIRWKVILHSVKKDTSLKNLFGALIVGYGVNCVVPRFGEVSRAVVIGKWEGLSRSSMFGTVIVERVIDMIFLLLAIFISVFIWSDDLYLNFPWLQSTLYITAVILLGIIISLYLTIRFKEKFYGALVKLLDKVSHKLAQKTGHVFEMLLQGFASLKGTKNYIYTIALSALIMIVYALTSYIGFYTVGMQNIKPVTYEMAWVLMSISAIGIVIPTPGGTGSYHTLTKATLVLLFGFDEVISLSYAFLTHIISYIFFVLGALVFFFVLNKQHDNLFKVVDTEVDEL